MSDRGSVGPYERLPFGNTTVPLYLITFDKEGRCQSPLTLSSLLEEVAAGKYTDVHLFSHGWNNVFKDALELYRTFFTLYLSARNNAGLNNPTEYRPVAVGIIWPSTLLVLPWESTPKIAALAGAGVPDQQAAADREALESVAAAIRPADLDRLYEFAERGPTLNPDEARELASILLPIYRQSAESESTSPEIGGAEAPAPTAEITAEQLLALWQQLSPAGANNNQEPGFAPDNSNAPAPGAPAVPGPVTAGFLSWLDPRGPIRVASVLQMKDRAGTVGAKGVGPNLTQKLLAMKKARIHLIGHSYGTKVVLSSLCYPTGRRSRHIVNAHGAGHFISLLRLPDRRQIAERRLSRCTQSRRTAHSVHLQRKRCSAHETVPSGRDPAIRLGRAKNRRTSAQPVRRPGWFRPRRTEGGRGQDH